jgi:hypothetical protein
LRQVLPILLFTLMLTLAYALAQGNIGTAYRQRSQLLVFYFIFVAVGMVLVIEVRQWHKHKAMTARKEVIDRRSVPKNGHPHTGG